MQQDVPVGQAPDRTVSGLLFAVLSACSFGLSGVLATGLIAGGWSPGAAVTIRVAVAGAVLAIPTALAMRGRWGLLRDNLTLVLAYGVVAVAGCQLAYFQAVARMDVGIALLIEYTAPVAVVLWLWLRHARRPTRLMSVGAAVAAAGLVFVLDPFSNASLSTAGVLWALGAMIGAATYFVISADEGNGLPPTALAGLGLLVGAVVLALAGLVGILDLTAGTAEATYADRAVPAWIPLLLLGVVAGAVAYTSGIAASRRLGSGLASFVALGEVLAAIVFAWLLLDQMPRGVQLLGGLGILAGVVLVKLGHRR
ncbi:EamA family transporter [Nocardioides alcanivorans]|uniref:EamA family transporter n=1 Tax=Nocardioides alcanivorans TaxID=2897352 RepID=UPI001F3F157B|nr:DMT family transporter [Nocardioides alcanivorans]